MATAKRAPKSRSKSGRSKKMDAMVELLENKRRDILELYNNDVRIGQAASNYGAEDLVDRANTAYNREFMFSLSDTERKLLMAIEEAITRSATDEFGSCQNCHSTIAEARIVAIPWAKYCVGCQELQEKGLLTED